MQGLPKVTQTLKGGRAACSPCLLPALASLSAAPQMSPRAQLRYHTRPASDPGAQPLLPVTPSESFIPSEL